MVLAFTEEQKKEIEARGMMVIEFKQRIRNIGETIDDVWKILNELADKVTRAWNVFVEKFFEAVDGSKLVFEQISEAYHYPTSRRYRVAKVFSKYTGTNIRFWWNFTFKIKRWIARSRC